MRSTIDNELDSVFANFPGENATVTLRATPAFDKARGVSAVTLTNAFPFGAAPELAPEV